VQIEFTSIYTNLRKITLDYMNLYQFTVV